MNEKEKKAGGAKGINIKDVTICDATAQMLRKAEKDGVETAFHRAANMKPCPIGADSACCKHCYMGKRLQNGQAMSTKYIRKILKFMRVIYGHYKVYLLGGEPTLHPELDEILKICKEEKYLS